MKWQPFCWLFVIVQLTTPRALDGRIMGFTYSNKAINPKHNLNRSLIPDQETVAGVVSAQLFNTLTKEDGQVFPDEFQNSEELRFHVFDVYGKGHANNGEIKVEVMREQNLSPHEKQLSANNQTRRVDSQLVQTPTIAKQSTDRNNSKWVNNQSNAMSMYGSSSQHKEDYRHSEMYENHQHYDKDDDFRNAIVRSRPIPGSIDRYENQRQSHKHIFERTNSKSTHFDYNDLDQHNYNESRNQSNRHQKIIDNVNYEDNYQRRKLNDRDYQYEDLKHSDYKYSSGGKNNQYARREEHQYENTNYYDDKGFEGNNVAGRNFDIYQSDDDVDLAGAQYKNRNAYNENVVNDHSTMNTYGRNILMEKQNTENKFDHQQSYHNSLEHKAVHIENDRGQQNFGQSEFEDTGYELPESSATNSSSIPPTDLMQSSNGPPGFGQKTNGQSSNEQSGFDQLDRGQPDQGQQGFEHRSENIYRQSEMYENHHQSDKDDNFRNAIVRSRSVPESVDRYENQRQSQKRTSDKANYRYSEFDRNNMDNYRYKESKIQSNRHQKITDHGSENYDSPQAYPNTMHTQDDRGQQNFEQSEFEDSGYELPESSAIEPSSIRQTDLRQPSNGPPGFGQKRSYQPSHEQSGFEQIDRGKPNPGQQGFEQRGRNIYRQSEMYENQQHSDNDDDFRNAIVRSRSSPESVERYENQRQSHKRSSDRANYRYSEYDRNNMDKYRYQESKIQSNRHQKIIDHGSENYDLPQAYPNAMERNAVHAEDDRGQQNYGQSEFEDSGYELPDPRQPLVAEPSNGPIYPEQKKNLQPSNEQSGFGQPGRGIGQQGFEQRGQNIYRQSDTYENHQQNDEDVEFNKSMVRSRKIPKNLDRYEIQSQSHKRPSDRTNYIYSEFDRNNMDKFKFQESKNQSNRHQKIMGNLNYGDNYQTLNLNDRDYQYEDRKHSDYKYKSDYDVDMAGDQYKNRNVLKENVMHGQGDINPHVQNTPTEKQKWPYPMENKINPPQAYQNSMDGKPDHTEEGSGQPNFEQSEFEHTGFEVPESGALALEQSIREANPRQPGLRQPSNGPPDQIQKKKVQVGFGQPGFSRPGQKRPGMAIQGFEQPSNGQLGIAQPDQRRPGMRPPGYGQQGYGQQGFGQPSSGHLGVPGQLQPGMGQQGFRQPNNGHLGVAQPGQGQPGMGPPGMGPPGFGPPGFGPPGFGPQGPGQQCIWQPGIGFTFSNQTGNGYVNPINCWNNANPKPLEYIEEWVMRHSVVINKNITATPPLTTAKPATKVDTNAADPMSQKDLPEKVQAEDRITSPKAVFQRDDSTETSDQSQARNYDATYPNEFFSYTNPQESQLREDMSYAMNGMQQSDAEPSVIKPVLEKPRSVEKMLKFNHPSRNFI